MYVSLSDGVKATQTPSCLRHGLWHSFIADSMLQVYATEDVYRLDGQEEDPGAMARATEGVAKMAAELDLARSIVDGFIIDR